MKPKTILCLALVLSGLLSACFSALAQPATDKDLTRPARVEIHDVGNGTFEASEDFVFKRTGTKDSFMGTVARKTDGFTISFNIGYGAGVHMSESTQEKCAFYRTHKINDNLAFTGIEHTNGAQTITTTIHDLRERSRVLSEQSKAMSKLSESQREQRALQLNERYAELKQDKRVPANFWAEIKRDSDIAEFLLIVTTYKPKPNDQ